MAARAVARQSCRAGPIGASVPATSPGTESAIDADEGAGLPSSDGAGPTEMAAASDIEWRAAPQRAATMRRRHSTSSERARAVRPSSAPSESSSSHSTTRLEVRGRMSPTDECIHG